MSTHRRNQPASVGPMMLRVGQVAESLGYGRSMTYELIARGEIPCVRIGRSVRVPVEGLREWVGRRMRGAGLAIEPASATAPESALKPPIRL